MEDKKQTETDPAAWMSAWTTSTTDFWQRILGMQTGAGSEKSGRNPASQAQKMLLSGGKMLHLMLAKMSDPATINAVLQGMETLPEISMNMIQQRGNSYVEMQKRWTEQASRIGKHTEAYKFEGIDENVFKAWKETYDYMTLLQSPEYVRVMSDTINALVKYKQAKEEVLYDMLNTLPIPTNKEMDELYKEFHALKKRVREHSKRMDQWEEAAVPQK